MAPGLVPDYLVDGCLGYAEETTQLCLRQTFCVLFPDTPYISLGQAGIGVTFPFAPAQVPAMTEGPVPFLVSLVFCSCSVAQIADSVVKPSPWSMTGVCSCGPGPEEGISHQPVHPVRTGPSVKRQCDD